MVFIGISQNSGVVKKIYLYTRAHKFKLGTPRVGVDAWMQQKIDLLLKKQTLE
jgi:hypothetical protein